MTLNPPVSIALDAPPAERSVAFIDLGTNSVRMLLARLQPDQTYQIVSRRKEVVRLGEGEFDSGRLQPAAIERAALVLQRFVNMAHNSGASEIHAVATSATRDARNQAEFLQRLEQIPGLKMRVISGREEARLIYLGVSSGMSMVGRRGLFIDIGGGSTELIVGEQGGYLFLDSLNLGAIRLSLKFLKDQTGPVSAAQYALLRDYVLDTSVRAVQAVRQYGVELAVGSSGTIENLAEIACQQNHNRKRLPEELLSLAQLKRAIKLLCSLPLEERRKVPGINPERADIIIGGAVIIETLMEELGLVALRISERGLQDGLLVDYLSRQAVSDGPAPTSLRETSILRLGRSMGFDEAHARQVAQLALELFDSAAALGLHKLGRLERELLRYAALLHDVGVALSYTNHQAHSYYFIRNADLLGFDQTEIAMMANTALFHRKANPSKAAPEFEALDERSQEVVRSLCIFLSIAESLDRTHVGVIRHARLTGAGKRAVRLELDAETDPHLELWGVEYHVKAFEKVFGSKLVV